MDSECDLAVLINKTKKEHGSMAIQLKRIYDEPSKDDGVRILVDRLWPRGISKEKAKLDYWLKEIGPSNDLRKSFHHESKTFEEFKKEYEEELQSGKQKEALEQLKEIVKENSHMTLLFAAKNEEENQAHILKDVLEN